MNNKKVGNGFEAELAQLLYQKGFWVHNFANKAAGQPADIIAVKKGIPFLIDAKVCSKDTYDTRRIEENQKNSMFLWERCGNDCGYFFLKMSNGDIRIIDHNTMLFARQHKQTLNREEIYDMSIPFLDWLNRRDTYG
nr:MAG TPA: Holliday junction resolvase - archaeal type [Caudoviricetes sp.]